VHCDSAICDGQSKQRNRTLRSPGQHILDNVFWTTCHSFIYYVDYTDGACISIGGFLLQFPYYIYFQSSLNCPFIRKSLFWVLVYNLVHGTSFLNLKFLLSCFRMNIVLPGGVLSSNSLLALERLAAEEYPSKVLPATRKRKKGLHRHVLIVQLCACVRFRICFT
jgi:hypothetical protein